MYFWTPGGNNGISEKYLLKTGRCEYQRGYRKNVETFIIELPQTKLHTTKHCGMNSILWEKIMNYLVPGWGVTIYWINILNNNFQLQILLNQDGIQKTSHEDFENLTEKTSQIQHNPEQTTKQRLQKNQLEMWKDIMSRHRHKCCHGKGDVIRADLIWGVRWERQTPA